MRLLKFLKLIKNPVKWSYLDGTIQINNRNSLCNEHFSKGSNLGPTPHNYGEKIKVELV